MFHFRQGGREAATKQGVFAISPNLYLGCTWLGKERVESQASKRLAAKLTSKNAVPELQAPVYQEEIARAGGQVALRSIQ